MERRIEEAFTDLQLDTEDIVVETVNMLKSRYDVTMGEILDIIGLWWIRNDIGDLIDAQAHMPELMRELDSIVDPSYMEIIDEMTNLFAEVYAFNVSYAQPILEVEEDESFESAYMLFFGLGLASIPWTDDEITYEERMIYRSQQLKNVVKQVVLRGVALGYGSKRILKMVREEINKPKYFGSQIIVDEANHFANEAVRYIAEGEFEGYEISEVLDAKTCKFCASMHGLQFTWKEYDEGTSAPSFHPRCRGRIIPVGKLKV